MSDYILTRVFVRSRAPLSVEWSATLTLADGEQRSCANIRLDADPVLPPPVEEGGHPWVDYTPTARAALRAADPNDNAAILAAVRLDVERMIAELSAPPTPEDLIAP